MTRQPHIGAVASLLILGAAGCTPRTEPEARPNLVLIITDDQGYGDLGVKGNPLIRTPHIDAMAARSAEMTRFYVSPVCAPTRASLMTGRYNYRTRAIDTFVGRAMMEPGEVTLAEILRDAGYRTGIFGKWHLGDAYPMRPIDQGFEEALVHRGGGIGQPSDPPGGEGKYTDFMVDNGPNGHRYVAGMKGWKGHVHEGGVRSPFFVHWPARLKAGHTSDRVAAHIDVLPTVLDAAGVPIPEGLRLDGRSLLPLLAGEPGEWPDRRIVIQAHRGDVPVRYHHFLLRGPRYKLVHPSGFDREGFEGEPDFELYDMEADPLELENLADQKPEVVTGLRAAYDAWFDDVSHTRPDNYDPPRIVVGSPHEEVTVLTRQDWRHTKGRPWAPDSNGHWELEVATAGEYDVRLRLPAAETAGEATLDLNDRSLSAGLRAGAEEHAFVAVPLAPGPLRLQATLEQGDDTRGPWQVDVSPVVLRASTEAEALRTSP